MYINTTDKAVSDAMRRASQERSKAFHHMIYKLLRIKLPHSSSAIPKPTHAPA